MIILLAGAASFVVGALVGAAAVNQALREAETEIRIARERLRGEK